MADTTFEEAKNKVREIVKTSSSERQIRQKLTEAGFNGEEASVATFYYGGYMMASVMVWGPRGRVISV